MKELKLFEFNSQNVTILQDGNGDPLFLAKDIANIIEHSDVYTMLKMLDSEEKLMQTMFVAGQNRDLWLVTEDGLYEILMRSNKPIAKEFKKKVKEILKSVRNNGMYAKDELLDNPELLLSIVTKLTTERAARLAAENKLAILSHSDKLYNTTELAKELNLKSAKALNDLLVEHKIQFKTNGTWVLYSQYSELNLVSIKQETLDSGKVIYDRKWTQKGRDFVLSLVSVKIND